ncbi:MAG: hypothetical protein KC442_09130 [Thermomicrobiales bacterium]|nr:hypothetical protein [Thermomicrobiales bacterium]
MAATIRHQPGRWEHAPRAGTVKPSRDCPLPQPARQRGQKLLNQQFWLWGQDVRHAPNLLTQRGFVHQRPPEGSSGSPVYTLLGDEIALWGFGLLAQFAGQPPVYVNRFCCEPRHPRAGVTPGQIWAPEHLAPLRTPDSSAAWRASLGVMAQVLRWIITYEQWVATTADPGYRTDCLARWPRTVCPAGEIIPAWERLAAACEEVAGEATDGSRECG